VKYLAEIFQDDGNVHVDNDEESDHKVSDEVDAGQTTVSAVTARSVL